MLVTVTVVGYVIKKAAPDAISFIVIKVIVYCVAVARASLN